jgi:hypothetical protein
MPLPDFYRSTEEAARQASTMPLQLWMQMQSQRAARQRAEATEKYRQLLLDLSRQRLAEEQRYHAAEEATRQRALEEHLSEFEAWRKEHPDEPVENYLRMKQESSRREPMGEFGAFLREHPKATVEDYLRMKQQESRREPTGDLATFMRQHPHATIEDYWRAKRKILGNNLDALMDALYGPGSAATTSPTMPRSTPSPTPSRPTASPTSSPTLPSTLPPTSIVPAGEGGSLAAPPRTVNVPGLGPGMRIGATPDGRPVYLFPSGKRLALKREALRELNASP